ncbi:hypothetical protein ACN47E_001829 [Coniothyrium glycines]
MHASLSTLANAPMTIISAAVLPRATLVKPSVTHEASTFSSDYHSRQVLTTDNNRSLDSSVAAACDPVHSSSNGEAQEARCANSSSYPSVASRAGSHGAFYVLKSQVLTSNETALSLPQNPRAQIASWLP